MTDPPSLEMASPSRRDTAGTDRQDRQVAALSKSKRLRRLVKSLGTRVQCTDICPEAHATIAEVEVKGTREFPDEEEEVSAL